MDVLQNLSHNSRRMINFCRNDGGNITSITKEVLSQSGGCVSVRSELKKLHPKLLSPLLNASCWMKNMQKRKNQTVIWRISNAPGGQWGSERQRQVSERTRHGHGMNFLSCWVPCNAYRCRVKLWGKLLYFIMVVDIIVELSTFGGNIHVPWILSAFCGNINIPWILSPFSRNIHVLWILSAFCGYYPHFPYYEIHSS